MQISRVRQSSGSERIPRAYFPYALHHVQYTPWKHVTNLLHVLRVLREYDFRLPAAQVVPMLECMARMHAKQLGLR